MVMTKNEARNMLEGLVPESQNEQEAVASELIKKEPTYWKEAPPVRVNTIPLSPDMLYGEIYYRSASTKANPEGLVTILDEDFVRYRVGQLLAPLKDKIAELAEAELLNDFIFSAVATYQELTEEKEAQKKEQRKQEVLDKSERYYNRFKGLLVAANKQMVTWTKEQMVAWIASNMEL